MFKEFYYCTYHLFSRVKTNNAPAFNACLYISMLMCCNIATIIILFSSLSDISLKTTDKNSPVYSGLFLGFGVFAINYLTLYSKRAIIFKEYETLPQEEINKRLIYYRIYEVLSFSLLFIAGICLT